MEQYYYLIASLPMLEFGMKPPFSYNDFLFHCEGQLNSHDIEILRSASITPLAEARNSHGMLREWNEFNRLLKNEIVRHRALKRSKDPFKYIRGESSSFHFKSGFVEWIVKQDSPLESELSIDKLKWEELDELIRGHYFDIYYLLGYALKLQILERWENINSGGGMQILAEFLK